MIFPMNCMVFILLLPGQGYCFRVYLLGGFPLVVYKYSSLLYHTLVWLDGLRAGEIIRSPLLEVPGHLCMPPVLARSRW